MKLIDSKYRIGSSGVDGAWERTWLADTEAEITADHDPDSAVGSKVLAIDTGAVFIKNTEKKWQKFGSTQVVT